MIPADVIRLIKSIGLRPSRDVGQHFLLDETVVERMVEAAKVGPNDTILEIGPGFGVLTEKLLASGANVVAVELDTRLAGYLEKKFGKNSRLKVITGDIFRVRLDQVLKDRAYKLVANLPYSATSLVFRQFLTVPPRPTTMCVLIQREVASRIVAKPGEMSMLALSVQYFGQPEKLFDVDQKLFFPIPKVVSSVLMVNNLIDGDPKDSKNMFRLAKMAFAGKRKQLRNSVAAGLHEESTQIADWLMEEGIPPEARPQDLSIEEWLKLAKNKHFTLDTKR